MLHYEADDSNKGKVLFSEFNLKGHKLIAMDGPGEHHFNFNEGVSFVVECNNQEEIDYHWNKLTKGGKESMCGWLEDKYGVFWQVIPKQLGKLFSDPNKAQKVGEALMKMKKINLEILLSV